MIGDKKQSIALVGAGGMGKRWIGAIQKSPELVLSVVCDKDTVSAERALGDNVSGVLISNDWREIARSPSIDAVIIVLPHSLLAPVSAVFLKNKKHVLCEKPGGITTKEIRNNITLARTHQVRYMVGFNHRFHDGFLKARRYFNQGVIGEPLFIRSRYGFGGRKGYDKEWRLDKKRGGGELLDQGVHMIDLIRWFFGDITEVQGFAKNLFWGGTAEDNAFVLLKNKKGKLASMHVSLSMWKANHVFEIYGTKGYLVIDGLGRKYLGDYGGGEKLIIGQRTKNFKAKEKIISCGRDADKSLEREVREFVASIKEKRTPSPGGIDAIKTLEIVKKIYAQNK